MIGGADSARPWAWTLAAIAVGGAALRLAGIGAESVDLEEYACIGALHTGGLHHFLTEQRALYPYGAPLAPLFFYLWSGLFGAGIVAVRMLSALAGTVMLVLLALLAREIWPGNLRTARTAGLIAALCAALSPVHLFQAQEARMYAFVALFAALSGLSLLRAARTGQRRWWAVNLAANAALVWSHYFAVFLWPVQALWLLFAPGVRWRTRLLWLVAQALLLVPVAAWISGIAPQPKELHDYYTMPEPGLVARNLVAGDAVHWSSSSYFPSGRAWSFAPEAVRQVIVDAHPLGDALIAGTFSAALLWGVLLLFKRRAVRDANTGYLLLWAVMPLLALVALSFAWKPVYASRYLAHSSLALYLLLGGLMAQLPGRFRALCAAVLVTVYAWQLSLALPPQTRTAWKQTGQAIEAADGARAVTLVQGVFWKPIFEANLPSSGRMVTAVLEPEAMAEMGAFMAKTGAALEPGANPSCWAVLVDTIHGQPGRFEAAAAPWNVRLEKHEFPGERQLDAYRISPDPGTVQAKEEPSPPALLDLAAVLAGHAGDPAIAAFQETIRTRTDAEGGGYLRLGVDLARHGRTALAAAVLDEALARFPAHLVDLVSLQRVLSGKGDFAPLADHALDRIKTYPERTSTLRQVLESLLKLGEKDALRDTAQRIVTDFPDYSQGYAYLGKSDYDEEKYDDAFRNLERAMALDPIQPGYIYFDLGDLYDRMGRCPDALRVLEQGAAQKPLDAVLALRLANAHLDCGDAARAMAITIEQLGRETHGNDNGVVQEVAGSAPAVLLELARAIESNADTPAVAAFQETMRARGGLEGGGYLRLGVELARRGRVPQAAAALDEALARFPAQLVDLALLQRALSGQAGFAPLADRVFERVRPYPERISTLHLVLQSLMKHNEKDALRDIARRMIQAFPDYSEGYAYLGKSDYDDRQYEQALPNLEHAVMLDPVQPGYICYALGDLYARGGRCPDALRVLERGHAHEPDDGELALKLANAHIDCGNAARAEALTIEQLKREPEAALRSSGVAGPGVDPAPTVLLDLARTIADHADAPAIAAFQEDMRMQGGLEGGGYLRLGVDFARRGRVSLAADVLDEALARFPAQLVDLAHLRENISGERGFVPLTDCAIARIRALPERIPLLGALLQSLLEYEEFDGLRLVARQIIAAFPGYSQGYAYLGRQDYDAGNYTDALCNLERAVALDPAPSGCIYRTLGDLYMSMGRCPDALRVMGQGLAHDPMDGGLVILLADAHVNCGDVDQALVLAREQLEREPQANRVFPAPETAGGKTNPASAALLDLVRTLAGHADDPAVAAFQETMRTRPGLEGCGYLRLGVDLARRGREDMAVKILDRALAQWPPHLLDLALLRNSLSGDSAEKP